MSAEKMVENILGEHYRAFFLIAYNEKGDCIVIKTIHNQLEYDALTCAIAKETRILLDGVDFPDSDEEQIGDKI